MLGWIGTCASHDVVMVPLDGFRAALAAGPLLLDGGLATELEARGHDLSDALWSARVLLEQPQEISAAHLAFFRAGAMVATTASYQVSRSGFAAQGLPAAAADAALTASVELARQAADRAAEEAADDRRRWVAASIGPYGACLADGSEYTGDYGAQVDAERLRRWHRPRIETLLAAGPDVLAVETIPSGLEVEAILEVIDELDAHIPVWVSVSAADGRTRTGEALDRVAELAGRCRSVVAVGANCCDGDQFAAVAAAVAATAGPLAAVFYPNSGERWDAGARRWVGSSTIAGSAQQWRAAGIGLAGGCCRVTPAAISAIGTAMADPPAHPGDDQR